MAKQGKNFAFAMPKGAPAWKKYITASRGGCDKYELCGKAQKNFTQALLVTVLTIFTYGTIFKRKASLEKQRMNNEYFVIDQTYDPLEYKVVLF